MSPLALIGALKCAIKNYIVADKNLETFSKVFLIGVFFNFGYMKIGFHHLLENFPLYKMIPKSRQISTEIRKTFEKVSRFLSAIVEYTTFLLYLI
jgi:hypothetical protein